MKHDVITREIWNRMTEQEKKEYRSKIVSLYRAKGLKIAGGLFLLMIVGVPLILEGISHRNTDAIAIGLLICGLGIYLLKISRALSDLKYILQEAKELKRAKNQNQEIHDLNIEKDNNGGSNFSFRMR